MEAVMTVFSTFELLEGIVVLLPPRQIFELRGVSKMWRNVIDRDSRSMRTAKCAKPMQRLRSTTKAPCYEPGTNIRVSRILCPEPQYTQRAVIVTTSSKWQTRDLCVVAADDLATFATTPRCQFMTLVVFAYGRRSGAAHCTIYNTEGVTIGDVCHSRDAMCEDFQDQATIQWMISIDEARLPCIVEDGQAGTEQSASSSADTGGKRRMFEVIITHIRNSRKHVDTTIAEEFMDLMQGEAYRCD